MEDGSDLELCCGLWNLNLDRSIWSFKTRKRKADLNFKPKAVSRWDRSLRACDHQRQRQRQSAASSGPLILARRAQCHEDKVSCLPAACLLGGFLLRRLNESRMSLASMLELPLRYSLGAGSLCLGSAPAYQEWCEAWPNFKLELWENWKLPRESSSLE